MKLLTSLMQRVEGSWGSRGSRGFEGVRGVKMEAG